MKGKFCDELNLFGIRKIGIFLELHREFLLQKSRFLKQIFKSNKLQTHQVQSQLI